MAHSTIEDQIQARVDAFTKELSGLIRSAALEAVEQVLGGVGRTSTARAVAGSPRTAAPVRRAQQPATKRTRSDGKRFRRTAAALEQDKADFINYVASNPGQRLEQIAAGMGIDSKHLKRPVTLLLETKSLRREGQRRGTTYFLAGSGFGGGGGAKASGRKTKNKSRR